MFWFRTSLFTIATAMLLAPVGADDSSSDEVRVPFVASSRPVVGAGEVFLDAKGYVQGVLEIQQNGKSQLISQRRVRVYQGDEQIAECLTGKDGSFTLKVERAGSYVLVADAAVSKGIPVRQAKFIQNEENPEAAPNQPADPPPVVAPEEDGGSKINEEAIGTAPNGNANVFLDADGAFRFLGERDVHYASNDEVYLDERGIFRGIVTYLDDQVVRRPLPNAHVYLVYRGEVINRIKTNSNGSFAIGPIRPGGYSIVAEYGYTAADTLQTATKTGGLQAVQYGSAPNGNGGRSNGNGGLNTVDINGLAVPAGPEVAWERERAGLPWQHAAGQLACQRIALRPFEKAPMARGQTTDIRRPGQASVVRVSFKQPAGTLPTLHLSPIPWSPRVLTNGPTAGTGGGLGGFGGTSGGGGGTGSGGGGAFIPPIIPPINNNSTPASTSSL